MEVSLENALRITTSQFPQFSIAQLSSSFLENTSELSIPSSLGLGQPFDILIPYFLIYLQTKDTDILQNILVPPGSRPREQYFYRHPSVLYHVRSYFQSKKLSAPIYCQHKNFRFYVLFIPFQILCITKVFQVSVGLQANIGTLMIILFFSF